MTCRFSDGLAVQHAPGYYYIIMEQDYGIGDSPEVRQAT